MTILCTVCGTANPEGTTYCEGCGVELPAASAAAVPTPPAAPVEETASPVAVDLVDLTASTEAAAPPAPAEPAAEEAAPVGGEFAEGAVLDTAVPETAAEAPVSSEAAPALAAAEVAVPAATIPTAASSEPAVPEAAVSEAAIPEVAAGEVPAAETPSPAPVLLGEAKLGIKKFGAATGEFIPLQGDRLVVGRFDASSGPVDIDLSGLGGQEHISRRHAELYREQGVWSVRDLGSTNGVYIKRKGEASFSPRLQEPAALTDGDELAFGNLMLMFHQS